MSEQAAPKFDIKMLVVPAILFFGKKIDFKDPTIAELTRNSFFTVVVLVVAIYGFIYFRATSSKDNKNIWVPPKPKPSLPFGLGPAPEPVTAEEYEATTYKGYETKLVREGIQSVLMSGVISYFMSMKFGQMSLLIQSVMMPLNLSENLAFKKYIVGVSSGPDGAGLYNEELSAPTAAAVAALNVKYGTTTGDAPSADGNAPAIAGADGEPRVVELTDEDKDEKDGPQKRKNKKSKATE